MYYFKCYKKKKIITSKNIILIIVTLTICYNIASIFFDRIKSDTTVEHDISEEECVKEATNNIVGVSKQNYLVDDTTTSWGSGVIISKKGYILTNEHVSGSQNDSCHVILNSNEKYKANIVWSNSDIDLAILKINYQFEDCLELGDSDDLNLGKRVYTIGNPIGEDFQKSVSMGVISGTNRNLEFEENGKKFYINNLIQTDAAINPGNSGGALINNVGQLIGITTIKISSAESIGFAVPVNIVKPIIKKLEETGNFKEATLGIWAYDKYSIKKINLNINLERRYLCRTS